MSHSQPVKILIGLLTAGLIMLIGRLFGFLQPVLVPLIVSSGTNQTIVQAWDE